MKHWPWPEYMVLAHFPESVIMTEFGKITPIEYTTHFNRKHNQITD